VTEAPSTEPGNWAEIELVVFDVDGTLYNQHSLRLRMARDVFVHAARTRSVKLISMLRTYRHIREQLADDEVEDFETALIAQTSSIECCTPQTVRMMVDEWIEERPLSYLARCRYPGIQDLFQALRCKKKIVGIFSDYPADAKLTALGLSADLVICARDDRVRILKPHPRGLQVLLAEAGIKPASALLIGDRPERDGFAARRAGLRALIRSPRPIAGWYTFANYNAPIFSTILGSR
jgi:putative hydrolase of the HAD superfamily